jgi:hypothetical protein
MWFAIMSEDVHNSTAQRTEHRPAHLARLNDLHAQERLLIAGPHPEHDESSSPGTGKGSAAPGFTGSLVVARFDSFDDANAWAQQDPFLLNGVYQKTVVKPFKLVLP